LMDQYGISRASVFRYLQKEKREAWCQYTRLSCSVFFSGSWFSV